jgi:hypothetical protein
MDKKESFWSKVKVNGLIGMVKESQNWHPTYAMIDSISHDYAG